MRLKKLKVSNFRCFKQETVIDFDDVTVLIGKNDSGKSSIFDALDIFLDEKRVPEADDCCVHTEDPMVKITAVFDLFPEKLIIDEQHPTDLRSEYLLNIEGDLEIRKLYNCVGQGKAKLVGIYAIANHPTVSHYNDLLTL